MNKIIPVVFIDYLDRCTKNGAPAPSPSNSYKWFSLFVREISNAEKRIYDKIEYEYFSSANASYIESLLAEEYHYLGQLGYIGEPPEHWRFSYQISHATVSLNMLPCIISESMSEPLRFIYDEMVGIMIEHEMIPNPDTFGVLAANPDELALYLIDPRPGIREFAEKIYKKSIPAIDI